VLLLIPVLAAADALVISRLPTDRVAQTERQYVRLVASDGLRGNAIPIAGRIVAVADVFDALTSDRVYRPAMATVDAVRILTEGRGSQFDPDVLDAFERGLDEVLAIRARTVADVELLAA
jgi:hypothetical protein